MQDTVNCKITTDELVERYRQYTDRLQKYYTQHIDTLESEYDKALKNVVKEELSSGSDMPLGFYNPSPVFDLVVGNVHRGKILKRITNRSKPDTKYGFGVDGRMVAFSVIPDVPNRGEAHGIVTYDGNNVTYLQFHKWHGKVYVNWIMQTEYDSTGRLSCFTVALFNEDACYEMRQEIYTYDAEYMTHFIMWDCHPIPEDQMVDVLSWCEPSEKRNSATNERLAKYAEEIKRTRHMVRQDLYCLHHDKDGYFTGYTAPYSYFPEHIYEITSSRRRKV